MIEFSVGDKVVYKETLITTIVTKACNGFTCTYGLSMDESFNVTFTADASELKHWVEKKEPPPAPEKGWVTIERFKRGD